MDPERKGLVAAGLAGLFAVLMGGALTATGAWRSALFLGAADAAAAAAGPGFYELLFNAVIPDKLAEAGSPAPLPPPDAAVLGDAAAPSAAEAAAALAAAKAAMAAAEKLMNCSGADCAAQAEAVQRAAAAAASGTASEGGEASGEDEEARLRLIKMKERTAGESHTYGGQPTARPAKMTPAEMEASFGGMIQRLKARAGKEGGAPTVGGSEGSARAAASGGGDDSPIMTQENQSDKLNSPTLRALQKLNKDSRHSVGMSRDEGTTDGSRDKAGKSFDGNRATFGAIPIAETTGAMGRKQIKADGTAPAEIEGQPVR
ncbi:hypothetical protein EPO15_00300 [bacterium]|nr:MAG: hypothetical protein EPO15_00300 [bacterium]